MNAIPSISSQIDEKIKLLEKEINDLVYEIYKMNKEEIKIIEKDLIDK